MRHAVFKGAGAVAALCLAVAGCGSSSGGGGSSTSSGSAITAGVVTSLSGASGSAFNTTEKGVEARFGLQNAQGGVNGHQLKYVVADDQSTTQGAQTATQSLVQNKHVFGIITVSATFYSAVNFTKAQKVPVVGGGFDGPEWGDKSNTNLFSATGIENYGGSSSTIGQFLKSQGATKLATIGNNSPSSGGAAVGAKLSAEAAGLAVPYVNTNVAFGTTDFGAIAIGMKNDGVDALYAPMEPNQAFALVAALKQQGVQMKAIILATGYGADLLESPATVQLGQGIDFSTVFSPLELNTPATQQFSSALSKYAGVTGDPTFAEQYGWLAADAFIRGLQAAGANPTQASFISGLRGVTDYTAGGLYPKPIDYSDYTGDGGAVGPGDCLYFVKLNGTSFDPIQGASPICGTSIPGKTGY